jgi:hypothetical protein
MNPRVETKLSYLPPWTMYTKKDKIMRPSCEKMLVSMDISELSKKMPVFTNLKSMAGSRDHFEVTV